jgi:hypothetical protein
VAALNSKLLQVLKGIEMEPDCYDQMTSHISTLSSAMGQLVAPGSAGA